MIPTFPSSSISLSSLKTSSIPSSFSRFSSILSSEITVLCLRRAPFFAAETCGSISESEVSTSVASVSWRSTESETLISSPFSTDKFQLMLLYFTFLWGRIRLAKGIMHSLFKFQVGIYFCNLLFLLLLGNMFLEMIYLDCGRKALRCW